MSVCACAYVQGFFFGKTPVSEFCEGFSVWVMPLSFQATVLRVNSTEGVFIVVSLT